MESTVPNSNVTRLRAAGDQSGDPLGPRIPPHNTEAEQALLGSILANNQVYIKVNKFLRPEHFAEALHGRINYATGTLVQRGPIPKPVPSKNLVGHYDSLA